MKRGQKRPLLTVLIIGVFLLLLWIRFGSTGRKIVADFMSPFLVQQDIITKEVADIGRQANLQNRINVFKDKEHLSLEIAMLKMKLRNVSHVSHENEELRAILGLPRRVGYWYKVARVLTFDPANGGRRARINRGSSDGILVGQPVIMGGFLYGRILEISRNTSLVITILDPNCKIGITIAGTNLHGILLGQKLEFWKQDPVCLIRYLPRDRTYHPGRTVETSGFGTMIPPGIPVGYLDSLSAKNVAKIVDDIYKIAYMKPLAFDAKKMTRYVVVLGKRDRLQAPTSGFYFSK